MLTLLVTMLLGAGTSCAPDPPVAPRLVVLFAACTVNRDYLSPYNPDVEFTPALSRVAREGVTFGHHWSEAGQSGIAFASIFSGTQSPGHGVHAHPTWIDDSVHLVTEAFASAGYEPFFWGGHQIASDKYNYAQGTPPPNTYREALRSDDSKFTAVLDRLARDPSYRALIVTNFTITHAPYGTRHVPEFCARYPRHCGIAAAQPQRLRRYAVLQIQNHRELANNFPETIERLGLGGEIEQFAEALELLYRSNIHHLDGIFGALVDAIDAAVLREESLVAFTADHGETLYQDNALFKWTHGWELAPEVLRVPWIMRGDASLASRGRYLATSRSIDVFPTLAGLAGLDLTAGEANPSMGVNLAPALRGDRDAPDLTAWSHTVVQHPSALDRIRNATLWLRYHKGVNRGEMWVARARGDDYYKYRNLDGEHWGFQRFDLASDPEERSDLYDPDRPEDRAAAKELTTYRAALMAAWRASAQPDELDEDELRALQELGYID
ncbi:MAG: sulfatase-like hydrolase/transferase [Myxococcota bacterium]